MGKFVRNFIDIQGSLHDIWNISDIEFGEEYNHQTNNLDFTLTLIRKSTVKENSERVYKFTTRGERDEIAKTIKENLRSSGTIGFIGEDAFPDEEDDDDFPNVG